ncbi:outer membrane lipoprotein-sorting protein [Haliovirga abyssi]|uniref:Uncharacterized protein TP-0789 domain-containing protein n=1 Tax=Haliovirga abyssi TaxID=2996794 RepID=A0AAU9DHR0_9FUSO|nr:outer membrane lipoprotein-sorting protein [Haliovirga abyssi]BDU51097.1 hypothetical protein HLVA_16660 [Haliovirga abyssi]
MNRKNVIKNLIIMIALLAIFNLGYGMTGDEILKKVDENITPNSIKYNGEMIIFKRGRKYTKKMKIYGKGTEKSFVEFTYPSRDKGTKYLRIGDNMWMYLPKANRTVKISGHMLRQSMMGSDFSYEDQTNRNKLYDIYNSKVKEETKDFYLLELVVKKGVETSYYKRLIWIGKTNFNLIKEEMYAVSGKLLKAMTVLKNDIIDGKYYPSDIKMEDKIKKNSYTEIIMKDIELDVNIKDSMFTLRALERK